MSLGSLRVDEFILPITRLTLVRGGLLVEAAASGPMTGCSGPVRLFTDTGEPVTDGATGSRTVVKVPRLNVHETAVISYVLTIDLIRAGGCHSKWIATE